uniref:C-type lectin domain-containing protein n=1 Tax=Cyprinodon variegatus TaxID=28743 RepID=A0A3Q2DXF2_CYPVA
MNYRNTELRLRLFFIISVSSDCRHSTRQTNQEVKLHLEATGCPGSCPSLCGHCFGSNRFIDERLLKCEAGWEQHGGKCYYFSTNKSSWEESRRLCKGLGGDLVKIDSREEQNDEDKFWIGLTDSEEEGRWLWVDGSPLNTSLSFWTDGQPDNWSKSSFKQADCVRMGQIGGSDVLKSWFDTSCDAHQKIICEKAEKTR